MEGGDSTLAEPVAGTLTGDEGDEGKTPVRKVVFKKVTPKSKMLERIKCSICNKTYESLKALQRHARKNHKGLGVNDGAREIDNKVTCMLCGKKQQRDLITRHIINNHGYDKPEKNSLLRGFVTLDVKNWKPLWLPTHEAEPPKEGLAPVDKEGRVHLYGVTFEPNELDMLSDEDPNDGAEGEKLEKSNDGRIESESEDAINRIEDNTAKTEEELDPHETVGRSFEKEDVICPEKESSINLTGELPRSRKIQTKRNLIDEFHKQTSPDGLPKVTVETFTVDIKDGDFWDHSLDEGDSDFDPADSKDDNETRLHNKGIRRVKRNNINISVVLTELRLNATIIEDFGRYMEQKKVETCQEPSKLSTVVKAKGHLFRYDDSYLNYEYSKDSNFNLKRLVSPQDKDFLELSDPSEVGGWLDTLSGDSGRDDPGRRRECLKAHVEFRNYLYEKIMKADFGSTAEDYLKREMVLRKLDMIKTTIENKKLFQTLSKQENKEKNERQKARKVLCPSTDYKEANCVIIWFESEEAKEEETACQEIYHKCMDGVGVSDRNFGRFAHWGRFTIACEDRNRRAVYGFTNLEFMKRKPKWLPPINKDDTRLMFERFEKLPPDWNPDSPPKKGAEPTCWVIEVSGADLKGKEDAQLVLTRRAAEICAQFREMKRDCQVPEEHNGPFFVNKKGKPLAKMQRTKGSLLEKFGKVCGIEKATTNSLRRAAETQIQNSPIMKQSVEKLQLHSNAVGLQYYDKTTQNVRASFVSQLSNMESPHKSSQDVPSEVKKRRLEMDDKDKEVVVKEAEKLLKQSKLKRKLPRSKTNKVLPVERELMLKIYSTEVKQRFNGTLPGNDFPKVL